MDFAGVDLLFSIRKDVNAGNGGVRSYSGIFVQIFSVSHCPPNIVVANREGHLDRNVSGLVVGVLRYHHQVGFGETFCLVISNTIGLGEFSEPYKRFLAQFCMNW